MTVLDYVSGLKIIELVCYFHLDVLFTDDDVTEWFCNGRNVKLSRSLP